MKYRKLGKSDLELSVITFGAWAAGGWMWGGADRQDAIDAIVKSYDVGVTSIDTAPIYGMGTSEKIVGEAIRGLPRDKVQILTKYGLRWEGNSGEFYFSSKDNEGNSVDIYKYAGKNSVIRECEESLRRLKTDYIDLYQIHWPDVTTPVEETMEAVSILKQQGKIRHAGVCNYNAELMKKASGLVEIVSDQVKFNMLVRDIEDELVPHLMENKQSVLAYSPMERGLLTGKMKPGHAFNEGDHRAQVNFFSAENIKRINGFLDKLKPMADEKNATLGQLVLQWTLHRPGITIALAGARNPEQALQNAKAADINLFDNETEFINQELDKLELETQ